AAEVGGIGIAPGANINYESGFAIFEATHGTAPDIAGKNIVNPLSLVLSAQMMLSYLGWVEAAQLITEVVQKAISDGIVTTDFAHLMEAEGNACTTLGTKEFGSYLVSLL
ncbi:MAG: isocitrate dehydrogenase, partial [Sphaerochaeta sp.]|nr:isocitrate dehydrogenase [Sphaerochaeta sp.]